MKPEEKQELNEEQQNEKINTEEENQETIPENTISETDKLKAELKESQDKFLRLYSEFDNYKKRVSKERIDLIKSAGAETITSLLPVLDDFERALKSFETNVEPEAMKEGINLIAAKMKSTLTQKGLKEMETVGQAFDTDLHDALTSIPAPSEELKGKVVEEVQKGYFLNEKVIRHAKVVIGQ